MNFKIKHQTVKFSINIFIALIFSFSKVISAATYWNGDVFTIELPGGGQADYLLKARYTIFIPKGVSKIKGILIHQHGCGVEGWGEPMATDAQYQAFAKKWSFAILGPDLYPKAGRNCFDWTNPLEGSGQSLITGLENLANQSGHSELNTIPWLLWGHSGGGCWVLRMLKDYPQRIIGVFAYSPGLEINYDFPDEAAKVPVMIRHAGANDFNAPGIDCWGTSLTAFSKLRNMNGLASIAYNANQNHNFSFVRLMAIPFFESVLAQRLPGNGESELREMDQNKSWLVDTITNGEPKIYKASNFQGNKLSMSWLPDSLCAAKFKEYLQIGYVNDITIPEAPSKLLIDTTSVSSIATLKWEADADIESGIKYFNFYKNDVLIGSYPSSKNFQIFDTNGDIPFPVIQPIMEYNIIWKNNENTNTLSVSTVNIFNLESPKYSVKFAKSIKITNFTKELIACSGSENNYLECNAISTDGNELHFEWYKDNVRLESENSPKLSLKNFNNLSSGIYKCMIYISGGQETVWTGEIPVYAISNPEIISQSQNYLDARLGENYQFKIEIQHNGKLPLNYQDSIKWYKFSKNELTLLNDNERFSGTKSQQMVITGLSKKDICQTGEYYFAEIKSQCGKTRSQPFIISIIPKIIIQKIPNDSVICEGNNAEINIEYYSQNCDSLSFQWYFNNKAIFTKDNLNINQANLKISNVNPDNTGNYYLEIESSNDNIKTVSEPINLLIKQKPQIISQSPDSIVTDEGKNFRIEVEAVEKDSIIYQWYKDSVLLKGYNSDSISKNNSELKDAGVYYCEISNECGIVKSKEIILRINLINSIKEFTLGNYIISPNPARDFIEISVPDIANHTLKGVVEKVQMFDMLGIEVGQYSLIDDKNRIDISHLPSGIYFIKIGDKVEKFVKM